MNKKILVITQRIFEKMEMGCDNRILSMVDFLENNKFNINIFYIGSDPDILNYKSKYNLIFSKKQISFKLVIKKLLKKTFFWKFVNKIRNNISSEYILSTDIKNIKILENHLKLNNYDIILFEYIDSSYLFDIARKYNPQAKLVIDTHDIMYKRYLKFKEIKNLSNILKITKEEEISILKKFDLVIAIQNDEYEELKKELNNDKVVLSMHGIEDNIFDSFTYTISKSNKLKIVFFAGIADFNYDAIIWFINNVWNDYIKSKFELHIYGGICDKLKYISEDIILHGRVDNIKLVYSNADIFINPIRFGSGLKIKNVEAMSYGIPLITTDIGIQGMKDITQDEILISNNENEFKESLISLENDNHRLTISKNSKEYAKKKFSKSKCFEKLLFKLNNN